MLLNFGFLQAGMTNCSSLGSGTCQGPRFLRRDKAVSHAEWLSDEDLTAPLKAAGKKKSPWTKMLPGADVTKFSVSAGLFEVGMPSSIRPRVPEAQTSM